MRRRHLHLHLHHSLLAPTDLVRQYRKLDDQVVTRLNRAQAQLRDEARVGKGSGNEGMCAQMWSEIMGEFFGVGGGGALVASGDRGNADGEVEEVGLQDERGEIGRGGEAARRRAAWPVLLHIEAWCSCSLFFAC